MNPHQMLLENNPFVSGSAGSPWENDQPDVVSINREAFEGVQRLLKHKVAYPKEPLACLVLGEAGQGKTHLLKRVLQTQRDMEVPIALFASVKPILSSETPMRHLLRELVVELGKRPHDGRKFTQLDRIVAEIVRDALRHYSKTNAKALALLEEDPLFVFSKDVNARSRIAAMKRSVDYIYDEENDVDRNFLKVLMQYHEPAKRRVALDWLRGDVIDEEDCKTLDVQDRSGDSVSSLESEARQLLISFGAIMRRYKVPVIVAFDQLDIIEGRDRIRAFEEMLYLLVNDTHGLLPVVFGRAQAWNERLKDQLEAGVVGRLEDNRFHLANCMIPQAHEIVRARIASRLDGRTDEATRWLLERLDGTLREGASPRHVIQLANRAIQTGSPEDTTGDDVRLLDGADPIDVVAEAFEKECAEIAQDFEGWPKDADRLTFALEQFAKSSGWKELANSDKKKKYVKLIADLGEIAVVGSPVAFIINTVDNANSVSAALRRAVEFVEKHPQGQCYYISDARCKFEPPPGWPSCNKPRQQFESHGGQVVFLEKDEAVRWYAVFSLAGKIIEGDITYPSDDGRMETTTEAQFLEFLRSDRFEPLLGLGDSARKPVETPKKPPTLPKSEEGEEAEGPRRMRELVEALAAFKLPVGDEGFVLGPRFVRLKIRPNPRHGVTVAKIENKAKDLQVAMSLGAPPLIQAQGGHVSVDIPRKSREPLTLGDVLDSGVAPDSNGAFPLGAEIDGTVFWADLAEPTMTSLLIGGTAGSGKSELLKSIVVGLAIHAPAGAVKFSLIDPKRVTFTNYADLPCLDGALILDNESAMERLEDLVDEMQERYDVFHHAKVNDIVEYNRNAKRPFARRVVVVDEYADMIIDKTSKDRLETAIQRIGQMGRAAGIHLVLATQRPDAKVVNPLIKANLQLKIALQVTTRTNSGVILDQNGAEYLLGHGDMLAGGSCPVRRLQGPLTTDSSLKRLRKKYAEAGETPYRDSAFKE